MLAKKNARGFTLIELMVVMSIIAILATIGVITYSQAQYKGRDYKRKQDLRNIQGALEVYYQKNSIYPLPVDLETALVDGGYLSELPEQPDGTNYHYVNADGSKFALCANLENETDSERTEDPTNAGDCPAVGDDFVIKSL